MEFRSARFAGDPLLREIFEDPDSGTRKLGPGSPAASVALVQQALWDLTIVEAVDSQITHATFVLGSYGPLTMRAVIAYKTRYDIHFPPDEPVGFIDEFAGPRTLRRLDGHCALLDLAVESILAKARDLQAGGMALVLPPHPDPAAPTTIPVPGTTGCERSFFLGAEVRGHVYFRPELDAFEVHGVIDHFYREEAGGPAGPLGFPVSDREDREDGAIARFQGGDLVLDAQTGAVTTRLDGNVVAPGDALSVF